MRALEGIGKTLAVAALCVVLGELGLRVVRSVTRGGALHLASPSADVVPHSEYGWMSPAARRVEKRDDCYGDGWVTYNEAGFRAPPQARSGEADVLVCLLGDSVVQGFQLPDGRHLPHLLAARLRQRYTLPYVLPLAVGGYGSLQQWMLFEEHCRGRGPAAVIQHWNANDAINNSYLAERFSGPLKNNVRPRPYLEDGRIVVRRPYPLRLADPIDRLLLSRTLNALVLRWDVDPELSRRGLEQGWKVAEEVAGRLASSGSASSGPEAIALVERGQDRAIEMFRGHGFRLAIHQPMEAGETCLPRDPHPNAAGHRRLLAALWPVLEQALAARSGGAGSLEPPGQPAGGIARRPGPD